LAKLLTHTCNVSSYDYSCWLAGNTDML